jgi:hypothetical protein
VNLYIPVNDDLSRIKQVFTLNLVQEQRPNEERQNEEPEGVLGMSQKQSAIQDISSGSVYLLYNTANFFTSPCREISK